MPDAAATDFVSWFKRHGTQDERVGLCDWPGMGRGAVALEDIEVNINMPKDERSELCDNQKGYGWQEEQQLMCYSLDDTINDR